MRHRLKMAGLYLGLVMAGVAGGFQLRAQGQAGTAAAQAGASAGARGHGGAASQVRAVEKSSRRGASGGTDDNKGTSNLITPQKVLSAVETGQERHRRVAGACRAQQVAAADVNPNGVFHRTTNDITDGGTTDNYQVSYHGQTVAHMDTWCHFFENGQMYNGVPVKDNITPEAGCKKGSVMNWKDGIFDARRPLRHRAAERRRLGRPGDADHARRSRSVGKEVRREGRTWRHRAALHRPLEAARGDGAVDRPGRGLLRRHDSLDARADAGLHRPRLQHRLESAAGLGGDAQPDPCRGAQLDGHQHRRVPRPGAGGRDGETS